jgi:hypothetical protein
VTATPFVTLDPTGYRGADMRPARAERPVSLDGLTIGLLANGKVNSVELLEAVLVELEARHDLAAVVRIVKESVSVAPSEADIARLVDDCGAVITAIGD